jgi:hypothetical protein
MKSILKVICLSASLRFEEEIKMIISQSETSVINVLFPNFPAKEDKNDLTSEKMKKNSLL